MPRYVWKDAGQPYLDAPVDFGGRVVTFIPAGERPFTKVGVVLVEIEGGPAESGESEGIETTGTLTSGNVGEVRTVDEEREVFEDAMDLDRDGVYQDEPVDLTYHCNAEKSDGEKCTREVSNPDETCWQHDE